MPPSPCRVLVRNRRWAAAQRAASSSQDEDDYFTETAMKQRDPLLYQHLVGQHLSQQQKQQQQQEFDKADCRYQVGIKTKLSKIFSSLKIFFYRNEQSILSGSASRDLLVAWH